MSSNPGIKKIKKAILNRVQKDAESLCEVYPLSLADAYQLIWEYLQDNPLCYKVDSPWVEQYLIDHEEDE